MTRLNKDSKYRLRDFHRRSLWKSGCCQLYKHKVLNQYYMPIHPFSDEKDLLNKLGQGPDQCVSVDAYWNMGNDIAFIQVIADKIINKETGLYARWGNQKKEYFTLSAVVHEPNISREIFEKVMLLFNKYGIHPSQKAKKRYRNKTELVGKFS